MSAESNLFDKAVTNLRTAQILFEHIDTDEEQLNIIGYHLQQSLELVLKYLLEQNGVEYPKTHDVDQLIRLGKEAQVDLALTEYLDDHAEMFSQWEAKSRYVVGYMIEAHKVERALNEIDQYLALIAKQETDIITSCSKPIRSQHI